jgi:hypothetical protein
MDDGLGTIKLNFAQGMLIADRHPCPVAGSATGRPKAAVIVGHMLRKPFRLRDGGRSTKYDRMSADERALIPPTKTQAAVPDEPLALCR